MKHRSGSSTALLAVAAITAMLGTAVPLSAVGATVNFPAGFACPFDLQVDIAPSANRVYKEFTDKDGNLVRILTAGKGSALKFTNLGTGDTLSLKANGSVEKIALHPDGTQTWMTMGHNVLILFPSDVPAGPSTTLHVGRVVFTVDTGGVFTVQSTSGNSMDICAALSD
jgi:hypothetical protein